MGHVDPVQAEYAREARRYDRRWARYVGRSVRGTLAHLALRPGERVLDVGCGTGELLRALAGSEPSLALHGADLSREMLAVARSKLEGRARLLLARAEALPFPDASFEAVVSTSVFHHLDAPRALDEMRRVLRPGGRLVITDWCDDYLACRMAVLLLRLVRHERFRAYGTEGCRRLLEEAGFEEPRVERFRIGWLWGMMTARADRPTA